MKRLCSVLALLALSAPALAFPLEVRLDPRKTATGVERIHGDHLAMRDSRVPSNGLLLVTLGGTSSRPTAFRAFDRVAVSMGYQALSLDYPDNVISTDCRKSTQPEAFRRFREEIVQGHAVSDLVKVDPANSIEGRLTSALRTLVATRRGDLWKPFLTANGPSWSKIVVAGHSQGSGHAAYLGKLHPLHGVIMLGGPQDTDARGPVEWVKRHGATSPQRYYALLHEKDYFDSKAQLSADLALRENPSEGISRVGARFDPSGLGPIVISSRHEWDPHISLITSDFREVWRALLEKAALS